MTRLVICPFAVILILTALVVNASAFKTQKQSRVALQLITPAPGESIQGYVVVAVIDANRTNTVEKLILEIRRSGAKGEGWQVVGSAQSVLSDVMRIGLDTSRLAAGRYIFRVRAESLKGATASREIVANIESVHGGFRQQAAQRYDQETTPVKEDTCECTDMKVIADDDIPADSSLEFPEVEQIDTKAKKLGPNVDTDDRAVAAGPSGITMVENFRLNFMIDAEVKKGSNTAKCSQEQKVKATITKAGQTESPKKEGVAYPFDGDKYVRDNTGYTDPSPKMKEHMGTDPIHFRWIDAPGFGNSKEDRKKPRGGKSALDLKAAFYTYVKGSGENASCYCKFSVEMKMDARGTIVQSPRIIPGSKDCKGSTNLPPIL